MDENAWSTPEQPDFDSGLTDEETAAVVASARQTPERVTLTDEERAAASNALRRVAVDVCEHCGDLVISHDGEQWAHYRGPGSLLNRCQHTVPYGLDATPKHAGRYFPLAAREQALREQLIKDIEFERDNPVRGWNDHSHDKDSWSHGLMVGIKLGLDATINVVKRNK